MFFICVVGFLGCWYLCYHYRAITRKKVFFQSPLFKSLAGSLSILLLCIVIINLFGPSRSPGERFQLAADSLSADEIDTSSTHLIRRNSGYHYHLIYKLNTFDRYDTFQEALRRQYGIFVNGEDQQTRDIGYFGLGVFALMDNNYDEALQNFDRVKKTDLPYLSFCKGDLFLEKGDKESATLFFERELTIPEGNFSDAFRGLLDLYEENENFAKLRLLLDHEPAKNLFPDYLARKTLLYTGDFVEYTLWLVRAIHDQVNLMGLAAAFVISIVWFIYLVKLDIFRRNQTISLAVMFVSGFLSVFVVISFNDAFDLYFNWSRNGEMVNDFLYCFLMIGVPEELTKIFPLLILLLFVKKLKEPLDYLLFASASALGFAFIENLLYFQELTDGIIHGRAYLAVIGHMVDSSFAAYGFVVAAFYHKKKIKIRLSLPIAFFLACLSHGIYDFLLYHELPYLFFIFFVFVIQVWVIMINNCLNNAWSFSYKLASHADRSRTFIAFALTSILALEYLIIGFMEDKEQANYELITNAASAAFLIIFFSSNLSSFNLVHGYWRDINFSSSEKRGYGSRSRHSILLNWYFVNSIKAHNYVGHRIQISNDPYNKELMYVLPEPLPGTIVNRIILYDGREADPHWFIVKLAATLPIGPLNTEYVLVKLRYQEDSLFYQDEVQVFFKAIPDLRDLKVRRRQKQSFPFFGWAYISHENETHETAPERRALQHHA